MDSLKSIELKHSINFQKYEYGYYLELFSLDYQKFLDIQNDLTYIVKNAKNLNIIIFANHQNLLTMGRGDRQNKDMGNISNSAINLPLYNIKRGGGITMHGPHQWIIYPIIKLNPTNYPLTIHLNNMMNRVINTVDRRLGLKLQSKLNPLGIWLMNSKIASVGVGIERWVTNHGMAVNITPPDMAPELFKELNPCGLNSEVYSSLSAQLGKSLTVQEFHNLFMKELRETPQTPF